MTLVVVGDSFSNPAPPAPRPWPELLGERLGLVVANQALPGAGHVAYGDHPQPAPFSRQIQTATVEHPALVVVFGSVNDRSVNRDVLGLKAWVTLWMAQQRWPAAHHLWIGPQWSGPSPCPVDVAEARNSVRAGVWNLAFQSWRDPIAENWLPMDRPEWWGPDRFHPSAAGHVHLADLIEPSARALLAG